jgi:predicted HTH transcriptional regulator
MTDDDIKRLIELRSEGPNLDYKAGFAWTKDSRDKKYELVRDLIALANTKDGGRVIFGVRDGDCELVGVATDVYESVDASSVVQMLHDNAAPQVRCSIYKREINGKKVIVFDVAEFDETPIICTNGIVSADGSKRVILRQAAVYVRTVAATTEEVSSPDDMRKLIARAVTRKADELLKAMRELLVGRPVGVASDAATAYAPEIDDADAFLRSGEGEA